MKKIHLIFLSVTSGILLSLPWVLPFLGWVLLFAFVPLMLADDLCFMRRKTSDFSFQFLLGFSSFLIWNILSTWWIAYVSFAGMLFVTSLNTLFMAAVWWVKNNVRLRLGHASGYFSTVIFWIAFEFLGHHGMLRWPWLTLGNGLANSVELIQWYEFTGVLGGSLWILLSNILILLAIKGLLSFSIRKTVIPLAAVIFAIGFPAAVSLFLYFGYTEKGKAQQVIVVQPNINPYTEKFSGMSSAEQVKRLVALAELKITDSTEWVLFPETALPLLWEDSLLFQRKELAPLTNLVERYPACSFVCGAITQCRIQNGEPIERTAQKSDKYDFYVNTYNSSLLINGRGDVQYSHKNILVAGVEKDPFRECFSFLPDMMLDLGGKRGEFTPGNGPEILRDQSDQMIGPVICFESIFGDHVRRLVKKGAQFLVVLTNDGWWKEASGIWQHFRYSRIRAIETRRSVVRSANSGISGIIDQRGDIIMQTEINVPAALISEIRPSSSITFYARYGDFLGWICLIMAVLVFIFYYLQLAKKNPH